MTMSSLRKGISSRPPSDLPKQNPPLAGFRGVTTQAHVLLHDNDMFKL